MVGGSPNDWCHTGVALVHTRHIVADEQAENEHGKGDGKP
jgi:hypothetical protein